MGITGKPLYIGFMWLEGKKPFKESNLGRYEVNEHILTRLI